MSRPCEACGEAAIVPLYRLPRQDGLDLPVITPLCAKCARMIAADVEDHIAEQRELQEMRRASAGEPS